MDLNGEIEENADTGRKLFIPFPQDIGQGYLWKDVEGKPLVSVKDFMPSKGFSRIHEGIGVFSVKVL